MKLKIFLILYVFVTFFILLYCSSPYVNSGDSGEFITTSYILGIAHSPGYPLYSLCGKVISTLLPFGNYAYRVNILNVILTTSLLFLILFWFLNNIDMKQKVFVIIGVVSTFIFSESYFRNTLQSEVFILNIFFAMLITIVAYKLQKLRLWYLISFICGLAIGNHHTIIFLFPGVFYLFITSKKINIKEIIYNLLFFILGFSVYVYLPIRASKQPYFNWGNPSTFENFYRVITRKDYGTFQLTVEKPLPHNFKNIFLQIKRYIKKTIDDLTFPIFLLSLFSFFIIFNNDKKFFIFLFTSFVLSGLGFFILSNLPYEPLYDGILERFYILPNFLLIMSFIISMFYIKRMVYVFTFITFLCGSFNLYVNLPKCSYRNYYLNYDYGTNIMRTLLPNSILFMDGGDDTFYTLGYLQAVEKKRQDVELHDRGGLVFNNIYGEDFKTLSKQEKEQRRIKIESSYVNIRPVFYSTFNKNILPNYSLIYAGVLYSVDSTKLPEFYRNENFFKELYSYRTLYTHYYDYRSRALVPIYYFMESTNEKNFIKKFNLFKYCYYSWSDVEWLKNNIFFELHNLAYEMVSKESYILAKQIYEFLLTINNKDINALLNLGVVYEKIGDFVNAELCYKRVLNIDKYNPMAYYNLGVVYWHRNDWEKVIEYFSKVLELQPGNEQVKNYLTKAIIERQKQLK